MERGALKFSNNLESASTCWKDFSDYDNASVNLDLLRYFDDIYSDSRFSLENFSREVSLFSLTGNDTGLLEFNEDFVMNQQLRGICDNARNYGLFNKNYVEGVNKENDSRYENGNIKTFDVIDINNKRAKVGYFYRELLDHGIPEKVKTLLPMVLASEGIEFTDESWERLKKFLLFLMSVESAKATNFTNMEGSSVVTEFQVMPGIPRGSIDGDGGTEWGTIGQNLRRTFEYLNRIHNQIGSNDFAWNVKQFKNLEGLNPVLHEWFRDMWVVSTSENPKDFLFEDLMLICLLGILFNSPDQDTRKEALLGIIMGEGDFEDNFKTAYGYHHGNVKDNDNTESAVDRNYSLLFREDGVAP